MHLCACVGVYVCVCACVHVCVCVCTCMHVCTCVYQSVNTNPHLSPCGIDSVEEGDKLVQTAIDNFGRIGM